MKSFSLAIAINGRITIPDTVIRDLRAAAREVPGEQGGDEFMHAVNNEFPDDDEAFVQRLLGNAVRKIIRAGFVGDLAELGTGVGIRMAPAQVVVDVPLRVQRIVEARSVPASEYTAAHEAAASDFFKQDERVVAAPLAFEAPYGEGRDKHL